MVTKICVSDYVWDITMQNFIQIGSGVLFLRMRDFAPLDTKWLGCCFLVLDKGYRRDACTDFDAKYVKRRGSAQGSAFWGLQNQYLRFGSPFPPNRHFLAPFHGYCPVFWGWNTPKTPILGAWIGVYKPNRKNIESFMLSKLLHRF